MSDIAELYDGEAEEAMVGWMMLHPADVDRALEIIRPSDCYVPKWQVAVTAIERLHSDGRPWDTSSLAVECKTIDAGAAPADSDLVSALANATFAWRRAAERIVSLRVRRSLYLVGARAQEQALDLSLDPATAIEHTTDELAAIDAIADEVPDSLLLSDALADEEGETAPWVVPGLLRQGWRAVVVGFEGHGKTVLLQLVGWCASQGLHPFLRTAVPPVVVLHVDLENPRDRIADGYRSLRNLCRSQSSDFDAGRHFTWHRPDGIDLRSRRDRSQMENILRRVQPDLVCIGPLRKSFRPERQENDERAALGAQAVYDDLRHRYGFALLIEHHAPHADGASARRRPRPMGSSTWLGWSEFGFGMAPMIFEGKVQAGRYELERWRGDRVAAQWPTEIHRSSPWPWDGKWAEGFEESW